MVLQSAYTVSQIAEYETYTGLPGRYRQSSKPELNVSYLTALHVHHISRIPYENLQLHYSQSHQVSLDHQDLFTKIVANKRGRGGYCMETSLLFNQILRALGFTVYTAGVRIRRRYDNVPKGPYIAW